MNSDESNGEVGAARLTEFPVREHDLVVAEPDRLRDLPVPVRVVVLGLSGALEFS